MATPLEQALSVFVDEADYVTAVHDLLTKWRLEIEGGYILDCYYNELMGKYSYTLMLGTKRVFGWDNAPHHPTLSTFPHHVHNPDGTIGSSKLNGDPAHDLELVQQALLSFLQNST